MPSKKFTTEDMEKKWSGRVFHGCTVKQFLGRIERPCGSPDWQVRAQCVCGNLFECCFSTLKKYEHPSCGCRRGVKGSATWRRLYASDEEVKKNVAAQKAKDEAAKAHPRKHRTEPAVLVAIGLSEKRLTALWEKLDHEACCPAWKSSPEKFVAWGLRNGWHRDKVLVRIDPAKPWHPLNVRWENV